MQGGDGPCHYLCEFVKGAKADAMPASRVRIGVFDHIRVRGRQRNVMPAPIRLQCDRRSSSTREDVGNAANAINGRLRVPGRDEDAHGASSDGKRILPPFYASKW